MLLSFFREAMAPGAPRTVRFRIITLVLLILLPLLGIFGWVAYNLAQAKRELIELHRADVSREITTQLNVRIAGTIGRLGALASSVEPDGIDSSALQRQVRGVLADPEYRHIWVFNRDGDPTVETDATEQSARATPLEPDLVQRVFSGEPVVSSLYGRDATSARFVVAVPIMREGSVTAGLAATIGVRRLANVLRAMQLEDGWVTAIVDRKGKFVARSLDNDRWVGQMARPELGMAASGGVSSGTFENVTWEGQAMLNSFRRAGLSGWTAVVAVPRELVNAPLQRSALLVLLVAAGALALTLAAAFAYARRISEPVRSIGRMARAFATGKRIRRSHFALAELEEVQRAFETAAAESAHLAALVASSGDAIMSMTLDGVIRAWNPAAEALFGYKAEEIIGKPKALLVPPDQLAEHRRQQARVAAGENLRSETIRQHRDGTRIAVSVDAAPIRRPDGTIIGTSSILHDITARIASEEHRQFLMREIAHRSKNQLAIIQAIASQTARSSGTKQQFLDQFKGRLQGLSASHDLLLRQDWKGAPLDELVRRQTETFVGDRSSAVRIEGPPSMLTAAATEAIGLALHELATNSAKYGALSVPQGKVDVVWRKIEPETAGREGGEGGMWELVWRERDGPKVEQPSATGFGTQVIKRMAAMAVNGTADLEYAETGLVWRLSFPSSAVQQTAEDIGTRAA